MEAVVPILPFSFLFLSGSDVVDHFLKFSFGEFLKNVFSHLCSPSRLLYYITEHASFASAINIAYENVKKVNFEGAHYRKDIGKRAMAASKN
jgi:phosphoribosylamine-glycine ligase